jgi:membrane protein DedA with SNARE-associated domain
VTNLGELVGDAVAAGGYPGLAALVLLENLFPPLPSELILPLAGFYVGQGEMQFIPAVLASSAGSVVGALILYVLARRGGRPLVLRLSGWSRISEQDLDRADAWFDRHGAWIVFFGRLVPGARSLVSIPAGLSEMPLVRFTLLTALGSVLWNAALIGAGWALGSNYERVGAVIGPVGSIVVSLIVLGGVVLLVRHHRARAR